MCGIAGILGRGDPTTVHSMVERLAHRGPDGRGIWHEGPVTLGHARLSILDLKGSAQPMVDRQWTLIANCEIYNHDHLRRRYPAYPWSTKGDVEAILACASAARSRGSNSASAHATWIAELDGMFAFALWDAADQQLILARDPLGIKPLVRTRVGDELLFASEVKAFHAHPEWVARMDPQALHVRLAYEYPLDGTTLFEGVSSVRPGTVEVWDLEGGRPRLLDVVRYASDRPSPAPWSLDAAGSLLSTLRSSVRDRLMSDVPLGVVLSGGLDSSLIAALAKEEAEASGDAPPSCWTVAEDPSNPDWLGAEEVASSLDLDHHQHLIDAPTLEDAIPDLVASGEDLDTTVAFFQPLFRAMTEDVTVGLCGQGADELHGGYPRYGALERHQELVRERLRSFPEPSIDPEGPWWEKVLDPDVTLRDLQTTLDFELDRGQLANFQLRLVDRHSMAHGVEVRVPFLGMEHVHAASRLPLSWKRSTVDEKMALRAATSHLSLPETIIRRPKLPAGRATTPTLIDQVLEEHGPVIEDVLLRHPNHIKLLRQEPDLALGLGLFEAIHLNGDGVRGDASIHDLIDGGLMA